MSNDTPTTYNNNWSQPSPLVRTKPSGWKRPLHVGGIVLGASRQHGGGVGTSSTQRSDNGVKKKMSAREASSF